MKPPKIRDITLPAELQRHDWEPGALGGMVQIGQETIHRISCAEAQFLATSKQMAEALEFYANEENWSRGIMESDGGSMATSALLAAGYTGADHGTALSDVERQHGASIERRRAMYDFAHKRLYLSDREIFKQMKEAGVIAQSTAFIDVRIIRLAREERRP